MLEVLLLLLRNSLAMASSRAKSSAAKAAATLLSLRHLRGTGWNGDTMNIADGIMKSTGKETVWLLRCR